MDKKILVVEDHADILEILNEFLRAAGYGVVTAADGLDGWKRFESDSFDLAILDIMMPKLDGYSLCKRIRQVSYIPIIMLTALDSEHDQMRGYELEIDDYVTKPFSAKLLLKRIEAIFRREEHNKADKASYTFGEIRLYCDQFKAFVDDREVCLTAKEFKLLRFFIENKGLVFSRDLLLDRLWGMDFYGDARIVDTHIKNLRSKLGVDYIKTIRGVGYKLEA